MPDLVCDRRLYLTSDKSRVVEEGDPDSGWLFAVPDSTIKAAVAKRYGLTQKGGAVVLADVAPEREPEPEPEPPAAPAEPAPDDEIDATEAAMQLADDEDIDLAEIEGTGKDGRVTKGDVESAIDARGE